MIWAVGLRGAVAYGLALNLPQIEGESDDGIPAIESATLVIVVASTLILGGATGPLLRYFDLQARAATLPAGQASLEESVLPLSACSAHEDERGRASAVLLSPAQHRSLVTGLLL